MENNQQIKQRVIEENIKLFDNLVDVYDAEHGYMRGNYLDKIVDKDIDFIFSLIDAKDVLDVGGGTGFLALKFLKKNCSVDVIDISPPMLDVLRKKTDKLNLICGNAEDEMGKLNKKYDVVVCAAFLHHIFNYEKIMGQMMSLVKKNGVIYIVNEPLKGASQYDYLDSIINKLIHNRKDLIPAIVRGILKREIFWNYDTQFADYHISSEKGLPFNDILASLDEKGFRILYSEKYSLSNYKIFYFFNKHIFHFFNGWFKIIAQKT